ncbi:MAG TPA: mandelate racemase/muconate lactonizing enzyme family protein [Solirubrobacterales bacterium]|nr:mandelate racemase/muconate lactonizing enzyme family protein [Solirubrobacterales bacterium]
MIPYALPFRQPYVTSRGSLTRREMVLLRIWTETGAAGLGEAVPLSLRGGTGLSEVAGELEAWGRGATGESAETPPRSAPARAAVAMALADAEGREREIPLHELLAPGAVPRPVPCNATLTTDTPERVLEQARSWAAAGFSVFKLKLGSSDDIAQVEAVRSGLGDEAAIRLDANGSWDLDEALEILTSLESLGIELAEQPVGDLDSMAALRARTGVTIVADESVSTPEEAERAAAAGACDAVTVKLSKIGSLDATLGGHLPTYLSSALDGPVGIAAAAHVAQTLPRTGRWGVISHGLATERLFSATIAEQGPLLRGSMLPVPDGNGLGITIDEAALRAHRL